MPKPSGAMGSGSCTAGAGFTRVTLPASGAVGKPSTAPAAKCARRDPARDLPRRLARCARCAVDAEDLRRDVTVREHVANLAPVLDARDAHARRLAPAARATAVPSPPHSASGSAQVPASSPAGRRTSSSRAPS